MMKRFLTIIRPYFTWSDFQKTFILLKPFVLKRKKAYFILLCILMIDIFFTLAFAWFFGSITDAAITSNLERIKILIPIGVGLIVLNIIS
ncbi:ABC transporter ATP-binding protein, partial [Bacillus sp. JJ634]